MKRDDTDRLIRALSHGLQPVETMWPPTRRALLFLAALAILSAVAIGGFADLATFAERMAAPRVAVETAAMLITGIFALLATFHLAVPGSSARWVWLPTPPFLVWLLASGAGCWKAWVERGPAGFTANHTWECFVFIVVVSAPLSALLFGVLRWARAVAAPSTAAIGSLGIAALAAFLLQFFHPFEVTFLDLGIHLAALGFVTIAGSVSARWTKRATPSLSG